MILEARTAQKLIDDAKKKLDGLDANKALQLYGPTTMEGIHRLEMNGGLPVVDLRPVPPETKRPNIL